ncbi:MAG: TonB-dependent receptor plug domain-containing protein [Acidobacteria bacterium]|nr:TonB-dependent receptor plug domain-containing protein [Acidobacteriota bacterium]
MKAISAMLSFTLRFILFALLAGALNAQKSPVFQGLVVDTSGASIPNAAVVARSAATSASVGAISTVAGEFHLALPAAGRWTLSAQASGFARAEVSVEIPAAGLAGFTVTLQPAILAQELLVSANSVTGTPEIVSRTPGSVSLVDSATLSQSQVFGFEEALRKAPGLFARPEEGFSLRPNIGIRGLNPTRSTKVLLLEDGVPLAYAPYGDNASYYHPPVERFDSIEVVKGSGQIAWGPNTVGGVVNYVTPAIPDRPVGTLSLTGGNRDFFNGHFRYGGTWRGTGLLADAVRKQGAGARDNVRSGLSDFNFKSLTPLSPKHALAFKANRYAEDSRLTYSGLRLAEWQMDPRWNPFRNDHFYGTRWGASAVYSAALQPNLILTTTVYGSVFLRDWWRQSSNSAQRPNRSADPACLGMANLNTTCGNEGRLRRYYTWGVDPRVRWSYSLFGVRSELDAGLRAHFETQERVQMNGASPTARTGVIVEDNQRRNQAYSGYLQNRFFFGGLTITPGVRLEHVRYQRTNRLFNSGMGVTGDTSLTRAIPGIGAAWTPKSGAVTVFAGVHRGFAPPRTEDIIGNNGGFVELEPELSWNFEAGVRARLTRRLSLESTFFRMDYQNQIIAASLAGGVGSALTSAGQTLHQGGEFSGRYDLRNFLGAGHSLQLRGAWTWIPTSRFEGLRYSNVAGAGAIRITGNRLPYAPASLLNASAGFTHRTGLNVLLELVQTSRQFGDDLNSINPSADGQRGAIPGSVTWNGTLNVPLETLHTTAFVTVKNALDRLVLVDRSRGMLPGSPRLVQLGFRWRF